MATVVIIHGTYGSPTENWFPWLRDKVVAAGHQVMVPALPTPDGQSLESWHRVFNQQVGPVGREHILVGHSTGAVFICDVLEHVGVPILGSFFVSGFTGFLGDPKFDEPNETFVTKSFDWPKIRKHMGNGFAYFGDDDPYVPQKKCKEFAASLGLSPKIIRRGGHLNESAGFNKFDLLWADLEGVLGKRRKWERFFI